MRLVSWNVAGRVGRLNAQLAVLAERQPDVIALQETTPKTAPLWRACLEDLGMTHIADVFQRVDVRSLPEKGRYYGVLIASRWPLKDLDQVACAAASPHCKVSVLSALVHHPTQSFELHVAHVPPGASHGWVKIETLEAIYRHLAYQCQRPRILCGDFNTPQRETADGTVITWGKPGNRWDRAERDVLTGLTPFGLVDVFRLLNGYEAQEFSWYWPIGSERVGRRFDHIFADEGLQPIRCAYVHAPRRASLSDHSMMEADFAVT